MFEIIKAIALILSISGAFLVARKERKNRLIGFITWIIANTIWLINSIIYGDYIQSLLWISYNLLAIYGVKNNFK